MAYSRHGKGCGEIIHVGTVFSEVNNDFTNCRQHMHLS